MIIRTIQNIYVSIENISRNKDAKNGAIWFKGKSAKMWYREMECVEREDIEIK